MSMERDLWALFETTYMCPLGELTDELKDPGINLHGGYRIVEVLEYDGTGCPSTWRDADSIGF